MSKLRVFYIVSLVLLGVLIGFTVFKPMVTGGEYSEVQREQLLQAKDEWILQFDILNCEGRDANYTINTTVGDKPYVQSVTIRDGGMFTYIQHIRPDPVGVGELSFAVYKEGEDTPFEEGTYHLK